MRRFWLDLGLNLGPSLRVMWQGRVCWRKWRDGKNTILILHRHGPFLIFSRVLSFLIALLFFHDVGLVLVFVFVIAQAHEIAML